MQVAQKLDWIFLDADNFHPPANIEKMKHGIPLNDEDRAPWLQRLHDELQNQMAEGHSVILACSALKESYRKVLRNEVTPPTFVYLDVDPQTIQDRLQHRVLRRRLMGQLHPHLPGNVKSGARAMTPRPRISLE